MSPMIVEDLKNAVRAALCGIDVENREMAFEHPAELSHGDYSTNIALILAKTQKQNPREVAEKIVTALQGKEPKYVERVEIAGPGFIIFSLSRGFFADT